MLSLVIHAGCVCGDISEKCITRVFYAMIATFIPAGIILFIFTLFINKSINWLENVKKIITILPLIQETAKSFPLGI